MRWIWNIGVVLVSSAMRSSRSRRWGIAAAGDAKRREPAARPAGVDYRVPARSGSRPPRRSSATRSSQPPTWVSPMKICGTVQRRVSLIIASRCAGLLVDADLVDRLDAALLQQRLGAQAVRAGRRAVHLDGLHRLRRSSRSAGWRRARRRGRRRAPSCSRSRASSARRRRAARARRSGRRRRAAATCSWAARARSRAPASGTLRAPTAWPAAYSAGSLMSIRTAFSRLMRRTASAALTFAAADAVDQRRPEQQAAGDQRGGEEIPVVENEAQGRRGPLSPIRQSANYRIRPRSPRSRAAIASLAPGPTPTPRPPDAQARPRSPRRIDLEPRQPLHRLDRRRPDAARRRAGARGRPAAEGRRLRVRSSPGPRC